MIYPTTRRPPPMTAAECDAIGRRYRETMRKVDDALMAGPMAAYRKTVAKVDAVLGRHPAPMHKMADASGKWWQHRDLAVLREHIADRNRTVNSEAYKAIRTAYESASRPSAARSRARQLAEDAAYWGDDD